MFRILSRLALLSCCLLPAVDLLPQMKASASALTRYDFTGQLTSGGTVTGQITANADGSVVSSFSFDLSQAGLPDALPPGGIINTNNSQGVRVLQNDFFQFESDVFNGTNVYATIINLAFDTLPGPIHTGSYPLSGILQSVAAVGAGRDFNQFFLSTSALQTPVTTPEPGGLFLSAGALLALGIVRARAAKY